MKTNILTKDEMNNLVGGISTEELIALAWELTSKGGSSHWVNEGDGCWEVWFPDVDPLYWCF